MAVPNRWKEAIFWLLFSMVAIVFMVPISLIYLVIFLPYRFLTWPFRLARSWLSRPRESEVERLLDEILCRLEERPLQQPQSLHQEVAREDRPRPFEGMEDLGKTLAGDMNRYMQNHLSSMCCSAVCDATMFDPDGYYMTSDDPWVRRPRKSRM